MVRIVRRWTAPSGAVSADPGGTDHHHVGQVTHQHAPRVTTVEGAVDAAVARAEVDPGLVVVVDAHRVAHHSDEEAVGETVGPLAERRPGLPRVAGAPDQGVAL